MRGITVTLHKKQKTGTDDFNRPIYTDTTVTVENVLVAPASEQEITDLLNLSGRKAVYTMAIPKGDTNDWENVKVEFFNQTFKTIGKPIEGIDELIPGVWNKKVRCEIYV